MADEQNSPASTPDKSSVPPKKTEDVSPVPFAEKEIVKHKANKASIKGMWIAFIALFVTIAGVWVEYYKPEPKSFSQEATGSNTIQAIVNGSNNQIGNNNRSQSPSFDNNTISNIGNVNLGVQSSSGNFATGNSKQIINGVDNSTMNNFIVSNITVLVSQPSNTPPVSAIAPATLPLPQPAPAPLTSPIPGAEWPALGVVLPIEITRDLPKSGFPGAVAYEFYLKVDQGDRLHFDVTAMNGAAMRTLIRVYEDGNNQMLEMSRMGDGQHWTMTKGIPGKRVTVQIVSFNFGTLNVRVSKAN